MWTEHIARELDRLLEEHAGRVYTAAVLHIRRHGEIVYERAVGYPNPEASPATTTPDTLFDLASLTKLFTATAIMALIHQRPDAFPEGVDTPVAHILPEFRGKRPIHAYEDPLHPGEWVTVSEGARDVDAGVVTLRDLLAHCSGLPAWRPLYRWSPQTIRQRVLNTFFSYLPRTRVVYSDIGFILLGWVIEAVTGQQLDHAIRDLVLNPLGLKHVGYRSPGKTPFPREDKVAATEFCRWRGRRVWGEVHDENAWALGGVAGHAGLFGTARDVAAFGQAWLDALHGKDTLPVPTPLVREAVSEQAKDGVVRRGLGWELRSSDPESFTFPLSPSTFGHTGFTGTSLHVDPERQIVIACFTNRVYYGRDASGIMEFRRKVYRVVGEG